MMKTNGTKLLTERVGNGVFLSKDNIEQVAGIIRKQHLDFLHSLETHGLDFTSQYIGSDLIIWRIPIRTFLKNIVEADIGFYIMPKADIHFAIRRLKKLKRTLGLGIWSKL